MKLAKTPVYLTAEGKSALEAELDELLNVRRPEIAAAILAAREDGDLRENGAYHDAKERQGLMEARIRDLKDKLERFEIFEPPADGGAVALGSTVTIVDGSGVEEVYTIVGSTEAKVLARRISNESPLGRALMGRKVGDQAMVKAPAGDVNYTIKGIG